jgi:hypothetical protein
MDEFRFYNRVLSSNEINSLYKYPAVNVTGKLLTNIVDNTYLSLYYPFDISATTTKNIVDPTGLTMYYSFDISSLLYTTPSRFPLNYDISLLLYYPFDTSFNNTNFYYTPNYASQSPVYDASFVNNNVSYPLISSSTGPQVGSNCLVLTSAYNQYLILSNSFTTGYYGVTFAFWVKCNSTATKFNRV